jgi:hypothetical protein
MPKKIDWKAIEKAYRSSDDSPAALALRFGVSKRSIEIKAEQEGWKASREAKTIVTASRSVNDSDPTPHRNPPARRSRGSGDIDELEIVEEAIVYLSMLLGGMSGGSEDRPIDTRGIGGVAGAMVKLLEYRRKNLKPATAADVANLAIALNIPPHEFVAELKRAWQLRA